VVKIDNRQASSVKEAVNSVLSTELSELVKTITADRGKEFALHNEIEENHNIEFYFYDPYSSWQRGANEQLN
jgi:IS30 family transposase